MSHETIKGGLMNYHIFETNISPSSSLSNLINQLSNADDTLKHFSDTALFTDAVNTKNDDLNDNIKRDVINGGAKGSAANKSYQTKMNGIATANKEDISTSIHTSRGASNEKEGVQLQSLLPEDRRIRFKKDEFKNVTCVCQASRAMVRIKFELEEYRRMLEADRERLSVEEQSINAAEENQKKLHDQVLAGYNKNLKKSLELGELESSLIEKERCLSESSSKMEEMMEELSKKNEENVQLELQYRESLRNCQERQKDLELHEQMYEEKKQQLEKFQRELYSKELELTENRKKLNESTKRLEMDQSQHEKDKSTLSSEYKMFEEEKRTFELKRADELEQAKLDRQDVERIREGILKTQEETQLIIDEQKALRRTLTEGRLKYEMTRESLEAAKLQVEQIEKQQDARSKTIEHRETVLRERQKEAEIERDEFNKWKQDQINELKEKALRFEKEDEEERKAVLYLRDELEVREAELHERMKEERKQVTEECESQRAEFEKWKKLNEIEIQEGLETIEKEKALVDMNYAELLRKSKDVEARVEEYNKKFSNYKSDMQRLESDKGKLKEQLRDFEKRLSSLESKEKEFLQKQKNLSALEEQLHEEKESLRGRQEKLHKEQKILESERVQITTKQKQLREQEQTLAEFAYEKEAFGIEKNSFECQKRQQEYLHERKMQQLDTEKRKYAEKEERLQKREKLLRERESEMVLKEKLSKNRIIENKSKMVSQPLWAEVHSEDIPPTKEKDKARTKTTTDENTPVNGDVVKGRTKGSRAAVQRSTKQSSASKVNNSNFERKTESTKASRDNTPTSPRSAHSRTTTPISIYNDLSSALAFAQQANNSNEMQHHHNASSSSGTPVSRLQRDYTRNDLVLNGIDDDCDDRMHKQSDSSFYSPTLQDDMVNDNVALQFIPSAHHTHKVPFLQFLENEWNSENRMVPAKEGEGYDETYSSQGGASMTKGTRIISMNETEVIHRKEDASRSRLNPSDKSNTRKRGVTPPRDLRSVDETIVSNQSSHRGPPSEGGASQAAKHTSVVDEVMEGTPNYSNASVVAHVSNRAMEIQPNNSNKSLSTELTMEEVATKVAKNLRRLEEVDEKVQTVMGVTQNVDTEESTMDAKQSIYTKPHKRSVTPTGMSTNRSNHPSMFGRSVEHYGDASPRYINEKNDKENFNGRIYMNENDVSTTGNKSPFLTSRNARNTPWSMTQMPRYELNEGYKSSFVSDRSHMEYRQPIEPSYEMGLHTGEGVGDTQRTDAVIVNLKTGECNKPPQFPTASDYTSQHLSKSGEDMENTTRGPGGYRNRDSVISDISAFDVNQSVNDMNELTHLKSAADNSFPTKHLKRMQLRQVETTNMIKQCYNTSPIFERSVETELVLSPSPEEGDKYYHSNA